ncbi:hypothetical protein D9M69_379550 [compost metagenome]
MFAARGRDQEVPALLQGLIEVVGGKDAMDAGRSPGIAEKADQALGFVLRVFQDQQTDRFLFDGHGLCLAPNERE